jgi:exodeoxyribonuclease VII large subunit
MHPSLSLYELSEQLKQTIKNVYVSAIWVRAEISEVRENMSGHCYLELVEKEEDSDRIVAKIKANIWSFTYKLLKPYFEQSTGQALTAGMKILVSVNIEYHDVFGMSLVIKDIDPTYSVGEIARRRLQIINRLQEEGVFDMNKELEIPLVPQRIAVISSPTAAGYGDFIDQLERNRNSYRFYHKLFPAVMQGNQTEQSIIAALEKIYQHADLFDVVVIIRGGGATADLNSFDSYELAYYCTQFPLPIITGIGHQRDETILDMVVNTSLKTPTAVAEILIDLVDETGIFLEEAQEIIFSCAKEKIQIEKDFLRNCTREIAYKFSTISSKENAVLKNLQKDISKIPVQFLKTKEQELSMLNLNISLLSPENILKKGYSITTKNGKIIKDSKELANGDEIETRFAEGSVKSKVK